MFTMVVLYQNMGMGHTKRVQARNVFHSFSLPFEHVPNKKVSTVGEARCSEGSVA